MSTLDFELHEIGSTNDAYDSDVNSVWSGTESARRPLLSLHKRSRKEKVVLRKGPAPLDDLTLIGQRIISLHPGMLDDDISNDDNARKELSEEEITKRREVSRAGSLGLLTYFAKLANSPESEQIDVEFVNSLLRGGADINVTDRYGQSIMHEVVRQWHTDVALFCMERGADIDKPDLFGRTPLHLAAAINYPEMIQWLVTNGADINRKTKGEAQTPAHYAAKNNAVEALQALLHNNANILDRDYKDRTALSVAAEAGRSETCRFLLDYGAPAGVFDDCGTSALSHMIEKMPDVAKVALSQFQEIDNALRRKYFHLNYLEVHFWQALGRKAGKPLRQSYARSSLKVIVLYNELNLIMHPVILQLIKVKWNLFGKRDAITNLLINFFFTLIWTVIGLMLPKSHTTPYYTPLKDNVARVVLEIIACTMTIVFIAQNILEYRRTQSTASVYQQWKIREIERDMQYAHPRWPEERRFLVSEVNLVKSASYSFLTDPWNIFEWFTVFGILVMMSTRVATVLLNSELSDSIHHRAVAIVMIIVWLRLLKYFRAFQSLGPFITMLGHIIVATLQFAFLFFEIFIPYCCAVWILFGGKQGTEFMRANDLIYQVFLMTLNGEFQFDQLQSQDKIMAQIVVGSYLTLSSVICLNLYIALLSDTFARVWQEATANAYMSQASQFLVAEQALNQDKSAKVTEFLLENCSPQIVHESSTEGNAFSEKEMLGNLALKVEQLTSLVNANNENTCALLNELESLKKEVSGLRNFQQNTSNEILQLTKDSSKWEIRNLIKSVPASLSEKMKRSFVKEQQDDQSVYYEEESDEEKPKSSFGWKWLTNKQAK